MKLTEREWEEHRLAGGAQRGALWSPREIRDIEECVEHGVTNAKYIFERGWFPGRTMNAIRTKITEAIARCQAKKKIGKKRG